VNGERVVRFAEALIRGSRGRLPMAEAIAQAEQFEAQLGPALDRTDEIEIR
jgi:hypothetical protein